MERAKIPMPDADAAYLTVSIRTLNHEFSRWDQPVRVTLRTSPALKVVGVDRTTPSP